MCARPAFERYLHLGIGLLALVAASTLSSIPIASASTHQHRLAANTVAIQSGVLRDINAARQSYGLPVGRATVAYQSVVASAARSNDDPMATVRPGTVEEYGMWEAVPSQSVSPQIAPGMIVNNWLNEDGWKNNETLNLDCTSPSATGCDDHRRAILSPPPVTGARLYIEVYVAHSRWQGVPGLSVATLLVWQTTKSSP